MNDKPSALYPNVPTLKAALGSDWTMAAWRGMVAPKGIPPEARDKLAAALQKIVASKDYTEFMSSRGFGVIYAGPTISPSSWRNRTSELGATMKAVGVAKWPSERSRSVKLNDAVFGILLLALAVTVVLITASYPIVPAQRVGPALFPSLIAVGLAVGGLILMARGWRIRAQVPLIQFDPWVRSPRQLPACWASSARSCSTQTQSIGSDFC